MFIGPALLGARTWVTAFFFVAPAMVLLSLYFQLHGQLVPVTGGELRRARRIGWALSASLVLGVMLIGALYAVHLWWSRQT
jgi:hypothetical protein